MRRQVKQIHIVYDNHTTIATVCYCLILIWQLRLASYNFCLAESYSSIVSLKFALPKNSFTTLIGNLLYPEKITFEKQFSISLEDSRQFNSLY